MMLDGCLQLLPMVYTAICASGLGASPSAGACLRGAQRSCFDAAWEISLKEQFCAQVICVQGCRQRFEAQTGFLLARFYMILQYLPFVILVPLGAENGEVSRGAAGNEGHAGNICLGGWVE